MSDPSSTPTWAELREMFRDVADRFKETEMQFKETDSKLSRLEGLFGMQWGCMMETLVSPAAVRLFRDRGIPIQHIHQRTVSQRNGRTLELDMMLVNGDEVVVVEVKTRFKVADVNDFLADLAEFPDFFPRYANNRIYGAVAGLEMVEEADPYAYRRGLFVLKLSGDGLIDIANDAAFQPRDFGPSAT